METNQKPFFVFRAVQQMIHLAGTGVILLLGAAMRLLAQSPDWRPYMAFRGRYLGRAEGLAALVNPVVRSPLQNVLSLRGEWEFVTRGVAPSRHPLWVAFYAKPWPKARELQVPGCWEAQGVGDPGMGDSWDCKWDHCQAAPRFTRAKAGTAKPCNSPVPGSGNASG